MKTKQRKTAEETCFGTIRPVHNYDNVMLSADSINFVNSTMCTLLHSSSMYVMRHYYIVFPETNE